MKILLVAVNAKYIHSNLAVRSLKMYAEREAATNTETAADDAASPHIDIAEYTINQPPDQILRDIYTRKPDMVCFSCYIWNIRYIRMLARELKKVLPQADIWLGGPEVSYDAVKVLAELPEVSGVMKGEGEETFTELVKAGMTLKALHIAEPHAAPALRDRLLAATPGITWRASCGSDAEKSGSASGGQTAEKPRSVCENRITENPWRPAMDMNLLPFVYNDAEDLSHRIIYYESSRGCPFSCSYCLSSVDRQLRFRDMEMVKRELRFFLDRRVPQVKFVDRTFNCDHRRAMEIWQFLTDNDNGVTNFHFEIAADLLTPEEIALIGSMRPGLIQLEIGVQSTNPVTIREIRRTMDLARLSANVRAVAAAGNIHQHLDLIAGLPYEDLESFRRSFDDVYALHPQQLQLGFLKVLKGSYMDEQREAYGLVCGSEPPYEVLSTRWLSFDDVILLKGVEEMVEIYYNSGQFSHTIAELEREFPSAFEMYRALADYYQWHVPAGASQARAARYELLLEFIREIFSTRKVRLIKQAGDFRQSKQTDNAQQNAGQADKLQQSRQADIPQDEQPDNILSNERTAVFRELLTYDYYLRENAKSRPSFAGEHLPDKETVRLFYENEAAQHHFLPDHAGYDKNQLRRMTHLETFLHLGKTILFDYNRRDPLTGDARACIVETSAAILTAAHP